MMRGGGVVLALLGIFLILLGGRETLYGNDWPRSKRTREFFASPFVFVGALCFILLGLVIGLG